MSTSGGPASRIHRLDMILFREDVSSGHGCGTIGSAHSIFRTEIDELLDVCSDFLVQCYRGRFHIFPDVESSLQVRTITLGPCQHVEVALARTAVTVHGAVAVRAIPCGFLLTDASCMSKDTSLCDARPFIHEPDQGDRRGTLLSARSRTIAGTYWRVERSPESF